MSFVLSAQTGKIAIGEFTRFCLLPPVVTSPVFSHHHAIVFTSAIPIAPNDSDRLADEPVTVSAAVDVREVVELSTAMLVVVAVELENAILALVSLAFAAFAVVPAAVVPFTSHGAQERLQTSKYPVYALDNLMHGIKTAQRM